MRIFDAHCHLQFAINSALNSLPHLLPSSFGCCSTSPSDWTTVLKLTQAFPPDNNDEIKQVFPAFGIHPWWANEIKDDDWVQQLEDILINNSHAVVGECGLDKRSAKNNNCNEWKSLYHEQQQVFIEQIRLAEKLNRALVVHCVQVIKLCYCSIMFIITHFIIL